MAERFAPTVDFSGAATSLRTQASGETPAELALRAVLELAPERIGFVSEAKNYSRNVWPAHLLPANPGAQFDGFDKTAATCQAIFRESCRILEAERIVLLSTWEKDVAHPERYHVLASSAALPAANFGMEIASLPQVFASGLSRRAVFFGAAVPPAPSGVPNGWALGESRTEAASAVIPVLGEGRLECAVLVQFSRPCGETSQSLLGEAGAFLRVMMPSYAKLDFLCRIYREAGLRPNG